MIVCTTMYKNSYYYHEPSLYIRATDTLIWRWSLISRVLCVEARDTCNSDFPSIHFVV